MAIDRVSLRLQSNTLTTAKLADLAGGPPTTATEKGSPVSSRRPSGPVHAASTVVYTASGNADDDLESYVWALQPLLNRLGDHADPGDLSADLVVAVTGTSMGFMAALDAKTVRLLSKANCGLVVDAYQSEDTNE